MYINCKDISVAVPLLTYMYMYVWCTQGLEEDIGKHEEKVQSLEQQARDYSQAHNFLAPDMTKRAAAITERSVVLSFNYQHRVLARVLIIIHTLPCASRGAVVIIVVEYDFILLLTSNSVDDDNVNFCLSDQYNIMMMYFE